MASSPSFRTCRPGSPSARRTNSWRVAPSRTLCPSPHALRSRRHELRAGHARLLAVAARRARSLTPHPTRLRVGRGSARCLRRGQGPPVAGHTGAAPGASGVAPSQPPPRESRAQAASPPLVLPLPRARRCGGAGSHGGTPESKDATPPATAPGRGRLRGAGPGRGATPCASAREIRFGRRSQPANPPRLRAARAALRRRATGRGAGGARRARRRCAARRPAGLGKGREGADRPLAKSRTRGHRRLARPPPARGGARRAALRHVASPRGASGSGASPRRARRSPDPSFSRGPRGRLGPRAPASPSTQLRDASSRDGRRPAGDPGASRARQPFHDPEIHRGVGRPVDAGLRPCASPGQDRGQHAREAMTRRVEVLATTVLAVVRDGRIAMAADGQVTVGNVKMKRSAQKVRLAGKDRALVGFAGGAADALALSERLEAKLEAYPGNVRRAAVELARDWRTDRALRRLEAMLLVGDPERVLIVSGNGDVIEPDDGLAAIGSGGAYALAAARALVRHTSLDPREIAEQALRIAAELCIYTNDQITLVTLP